MEAPAGVPLGMGDIQQALLNASTGIKACIWSGQYVDLPTLISAVGQHSLTMNMDGGQPMLSLATPGTKPVKHIWDWVRLFFTYAAIFC